MSSTPQYPIYIGSIVDCPAARAIEALGLQKINRATEIIAELAVNMYRDLSGWDDDYQFEVDQVRDFMLQTVEDCSECYDEDWFPILAVPAAEKTVNYRHVTQKVQEQFDDLNWREFTRSLFV